MIFQTGDVAERVCRERYFVIGHHKVEVKRAVPRSVMMAQHEEIQGQKVGGQSDEQLERAFYLGMAAGSAQFNGGRVPQYPFGESQERPKLPGSMPFGDMGMFQPSPLLASIRDPFGDAFSMDPASRRDEPPAIHIPNDAWLTSPEDLLAAAPKP